MQLMICLTSPKFTGYLGFRYPFLLAPATILIVFASYGGQHIKHHSVNSLKHCKGKIIASMCCKNHMARREVKTDNHKVFFLDKML
ncbi:hypothetical protein ENINCP361B_22675 [Enterobacter intestinihominis]